MKAPHKEYKKLKIELRKQEAILRGVCGNDSIARDLRLESHSKIAVIKDKISSYRKLQNKVKIRRIIPAY